MFTATPHKQINTRTARLILVIVGKQNLAVYRVSEGCAITEGLRIIKSVATYAEVHQYLDNK